MRRHSHRKIEENGTEKEKFVTSQVNSYACVLYARFAIEIMEMWFGG